MSELTGVEILARSIPLGCLIDLKLTCHGADFEQRCIVRAIRYHSKYSFSLECVDEKGRFGYMWIKPHWEHSTKRVKGFRYAQDDKATLS